MIIALFLKGVQLAEINNKFSEIDLFYNYLTQKHEILIYKGKLGLIPTGALALIGWIERVVILCERTKAQMKQ